MPTVTVAGAGQHSVALNFDTSANVDLARQLAAAITAGVNAGSIVPVAGGAGPPSLPAGRIGEFIQTHDGLTILPPGYAVVVDTAKDAVIFGSGDPNETVLISSGDATFIAGGAFGSGTVVGGGGNDRILIQPTVTGGWSINTGNGDDTVLAIGSGNDTISAGGGHNAIQLGSGSDVIHTSGDDTILAGSGSETIAATGTGSDVIYAGSGTLFFMASGASTVFAGSGSDTFFGGTGPDVVYGGTGGNNFLFAGTGAATLFGGGNGDQLYAAGSAAQALHAGAGNETLFGGFASGQDTFYGGTGNVSITGGTGNDLFVFTDGQAGGTDTIQGFVTAYDKIDLQGYGNNEVEKALKSQKVVGGTDTITLSDNTKISFVGVGQLTATDFVTSGAGGGTGNGDGSSNHGGHDSDDGQHGHGHGSQGMSGADDHGDIRNLIIGHS
jgi:Ca2+-binding RTX toxin-like protein